MNKIREEDITNILKEPLDLNKLTGKTVLVAGAGGFIGSYTVETLLALKSIKVIAIARNKEKAESKFRQYLNNENFKLIIQDITNPPEISEKADYIIHAASQASPKYYGTDPVGTLKANTLGTYNLLELAKRDNTKKFLYISSGEVYGEIGDTTPLITESYRGNIDCTDVRSCYGESKRAGENMCICYSFQYGIPVNIIRLSHTYGPGVDFNDGRVFGDFVKNIINNEDITLNSDGSAKRSFCYISDMITALFYVLLSGKNGEAYNIASSKETSILELAEMLISLYPEKNLRVNFAENVFRNGYIKSPSARANYSTKKLQKLGWREKTDIRTGFLRMIESYKYNDSSY